MSVGCYGIREKGSAAELLLAPPEPLDQRAVLVRIIALQVVEKLAALAHHLQQAAARMKILDVGLEVLGQAVDALGEERDLHFRGAGIVPRPLILFDPLRFRRALQTQEPFSKSILYSLF